MASRNGLCPACIPVSRLRRSEWTL
jgi:hypothetical protein